MNTTTKVIISLTVAAAAGAAIGMLLAPEKGSDLRTKIKEGATDWLKNFATIISAGKELVTGLKEIPVETNNEQSRTV